MEIPQLKKIRRAIEGFFHKIRFNIGLNNILKSKRQLELRDNFEEAISKQIKYIATKERIDKISGIKKIDEVVDPDLEKNLLDLWIPILAILSALDEDAVYDYFVWVANEAGQSALDKLLVDEKFELEDQVILKRLKQRVEEMARMVDETTQSWILQKIRASIKADLSSEEIAMVIRDAIAEYAQNRASLIAEHETAVIYGEIEHELYKKSGVKYHKWVTQRDELVCFPANVKVKTKQGYKRIQDVKKGEYVLTHRDRYKRVIGLSKRRYSGEFTKITLKGSYKGNNPVLTSTAEHNLLVNGEWIEAKNVSEGDTVSYIAHKCKECDKLIPIFKDYCGRSCVAKVANKKIWKDPAQHKRVIRENKKYNKVEKMMKAQENDRRENPEKYELAAKKQSKTKKDKWKNDAEFRKRRTEINQKTAQAEGWGFKNKKRWLKAIKKAWKVRGQNHLGKTYLEKKVEWWLKESGIEYVPQKYFFNGQRRFWVDFYLPEYDLIIEADGEAFHDEVSDKERDEGLKQVFAGKIIHLMGEDIRNNFDECVSTVEGIMNSQNCFVDVVVRKVETWELKGPRTVYNLEVEGDNTYTVNNIIVHNCPICWGNEEAGTIPIGDPFPSGVFHAPAHHRCRCFVLPVISKEVEEPWLG